MEIVLNYLHSFRKKRGLYIIRPKNPELLILICQKLNYTYKSDIAYIGKADNTKTSDLFNRCKQEMGWSNFEGATFMKKIGLFLNFDIRDKTNKILREATKSFICSNFTIECVIIDDDISTSAMETEYIIKFQPCLNDKKNN